MREELKKRIEEVKNDIDYQSSLGWEADANYVEGLNQRLERLEQLWLDMDY